MAENNKKNKIPGWAVPLILMILLLLFLYVLSRSSGSPQATGSFFDLLS